MTNQRNPWLAALAGLACLSLLGLGIYRHVGLPPDDAAPPPEPTIVTPAAPAPPTEKPAPASTFLDAFGKDEGDSEPAGPAPSDDALEKRFGALLALEDRLRVLGQQIEAAKDRSKLERTHEETLDRFNGELAAFEKELGRARKERPEAPVPAWLSGELLILIRGEPEEILPHLERARAAGLARPRIFTSLARALVEANRFDAAFSAAGRGLELAPADRQAWDVFVRIAFNTERFADVIARIDGTFASAVPEWAAEVRAEAVTRLADRQAEEKMRAAEAKEDDLPRVRLAIEHRRFARDERGIPLTSVESSGKGEVIVELFEDQAPAAVASFITLVEQKKYDRTRFYLAESAALVAGGDVASRDADPKDDGRGNPGYVVKDEYQRKDARGHYRGSLSLVNSGPGTSGSQFFITLVPMPEMDGQYTVFGRVLQGQDVVDRISRGRTTPDVGRYGRIIPGDLLVRAEVLRKRPHEYRLQKVE